MAVNPWQEPRTDLEAEASDSEVAREFTVVEGGAELVQEVTPLVEAALAVNVERIEPREQECPANGKDYEYNVILGPRYGGEPFGAAFVSSMGLEMGPGRLVSSATIETFHVDDENRLSAYLALLLDLIGSDANLRTIESESGRELAWLAAEINPVLLDVGWQVEYKLTHSIPMGRAGSRAGSIAVETFDPSDLAGLNDDILVGHSFRRVLVSST